MLNFFIERPVLSTVIALVLILSGALAAVGLPIAQYPQLVPPQVTVNTSLPGANAEIVSQSVAASIEQQVNGSQDMLYMSSKSGNDGSYSLTVTFEIGTDKNIDQIEVQNRVAIAQPQLPPDVIRNGITVREPNVVAPAGSVGLPPVPRGQQMQYTAFVKGRLAEVGEFENIVIRESGNGQVVRLKDVARIELAAADY